MRDPALDARRPSVAGARAILRGARAALALLTRIPAGGFPYGRDEWRWASAWLPVVGAGIGASAAMVWLAAQPLGPMVAATATVGWTMALTGALHEDGLADTADALGGASTRERLFEILKDSRIGTFGGAALIMSVLLRVTLLARLGSLAPAALVVAHALARAGPAVLLAWLDYVTPDGTARSRAFSGATWGQGTVALLSALAVALGVVALTALPIRAAASAAVAVAVTTIACAVVFRHRAGGVTGDFLGAAEQVAECASLSAVAAVSGLWLG